MAKDYSVGTACLRDAHIRVLRKVGNATPDPAWRDNAVAFARRYHQKCAMDPARAFDLGELLETIDRRYQHAVTQESRRQETSAADEAVTREVERALQEGSMDGAVEEVTSTPPEPEPQREAPRVPQSETVFPRPVPRPRRPGRPAAKSSPAQSPAPMRAHQLAGEQPAQRVVTLRKAIFIGLVGVALGYAIHRIIH